MSVRSRNAIWAVMLLCAANLSADGPGTAADGLLLDQPMDAKSAAMGGLPMFSSGADIGVVGGTSALRDSRTVGTSYLSWFGGATMTTLNGQIGLFERFGIAASFRNLDVGGFTNVETEPEVTAKSTLLSGGLGVRLFERADVGMTVGWVKDELSGISFDGDALTYDDQGVVVGFDAMYHPRPDLFVGGYVRNLGTGRTLDSQKDDFPLRVGLTAAYQIDQVSLGAQLAKRQDREPEFLLAAEWSLQDRLFVRGGWRHIGVESAMRSYTAGIGLRLRGDLRMDYAYLPGLFGEQHLVGLTYAFGSQARRVPGRVMHDADLARNALVDSLVAYFKTTITPGHQVVIKHNARGTGPTLIEGAIRRALVASGCQVAAKADLSTLTVAYNVGANRLETESVGSFTFGDDRTKRRYRAALALQILGADGLVVSHKWLTVDSSDELPALVANRLVTPDAIKRTPVERPSRWLEWLAAAGILAGLWTLAF